MSQGNPSEANPVLSVQTQKRSLPTEVLTAFCKHLKDSKVISPETAQVFEVMVGLETFPKRSEIKVSVKSALAAKNP